MWRSPCRNQRDGRFACQSTRPTATASVYFYPHPVALALSLATAEKDALPRAMLRRRSSRPEGLRSMGILDLFFSPMVYVHTCCWGAVDFFWRQAKGVLQLPYSALVLVVWAVNTISSDLMAYMSKQPNVRTQVRPPAPLGGSARCRPFAADSARSHACTSLDAAVTVYTHNSPQCRPQALIASLKWTC